MEQIINMSNQLIAVIVNVIFFLVVYGTIFYILGVIHPRCDHHRDRQDRL